MALADRIPIGPPVGSTHASPAFSAAKLASDHLVKLPVPTMAQPVKGEDVKSDNCSSPFRHSKSSFASQSPVDLSPTLRSISPDSLMNSGGVVNKPESAFTSRDSTPPEPSSGFSKPTFEDSLIAKKSKPASRVPIATGISTTIPVTGEKPKPEQEGDFSLEDNVLFAIFLILYEKDPEGTGMTVKQICDVLVERHPDMAQLSSKTSNLVSAKLKAYVKRVEKGDSNLKYALSREWADASPKRMVYVYRGILTQDFHVHARQAMEQQKLSSSSLRFVSGQENTSSDPFEAARQKDLQKPRRSTMYDLGVSKPKFSDAPERTNWFVPYHAAPVAAYLTPLGSGMREPAKVLSALGEETSVFKEKFCSNDSDFDFDELEVFNDTDNDNDDVSDIGAEPCEKAGKRSKSMYCLPLNKKHRFVTAAAAAPRAPKTSCSHSANAAAAADALHAAALKAISSSSRHSSLSHASGSAYQMSKWELAVRQGFMSQVIAAPEDLSLSELDKFFG